ncbi:enamine deaminase RidA (YjgF/YER057c/UK114 family) [Hephaestia caeni]|uniref:Enamine deaminase RidA (YjgF/YER057c/UK114 family) n=1 Tax=Hephaestia caeni TaxID=645617 RepID=A0A397P943_9SPHN|nr:RidA family protein [Hephaestia caeni]RIA44579.1 enamine deaminase RidA (YjgF/YER057c/UK114 family) [Hephaestia caeni]
MTIQRIERGSRMSQAVIHGDTIYLAGQIGTPGKSVAAQTQEVLAKIEGLLATAGSSKDHILMATIWLSDMADFAEMNTVWDAWIADAAAPARATGEVKLATPDYKVEIIVVAARMDK